MQLTCTISLLICFNNPNDYGYIVIHLSFIVIIKKTEQVSVLVHPMILTKPSLENVLRLKSVPPSTRHRAVFYATASRELGALPWTVRKEVVKGQVVFNLRFLFSFYMRSCDGMCKSKLIPSVCSTEWNVHRVRENRCHFIFDYNSRFSWSIFTTFSPLEIGMNTPQLHVTYLLNSLLTS